MNKIFQIGHNRCGTLSLLNFFLNNSIERKSLIHWDHGRLALTIHDNISNDEFALKGYEHMLYFSDMEGYDFKKNRWRYMYKNFKLLDQQYPDSKFILNIRDLNNWLESRKKWMIWHKDKWQTYADALCDVLKINDIEKLNELWKREWYSHLIEVLDYFKNRPNDLLVYDIEKDNPEKIIIFFKDHLNFKHKLMPHINKSSTQRIAKKKPSYAPSIS